MTYINPAVWKRKFGGARTFGNVLFPGTESKARWGDPYGCHVMAILGHAHPLPWRELPLRDRGLTSKETSLSHFTDRQIETQGESQAQSHLASELELEANRLLDVNGYGFIIRPYTFPNLH